MRKVIDIGAAPANADCAQLGQTRDFAIINRLEVRLYAAAIQARFGVPPAGCTLKPLLNRHDFGDYLTLALEVDDGVPTDGDVDAYIEAVENGLGSWIEAGFAPPIRYLADMTATTDGRSFEDIVMGALRTTRADEAGNWPVADFETLHSNLAAAFPALAEAVRAQMELAL
jgi:hypothetical protein